MYYLLSVAETWQRRCSFQRKNSNGRASRRRNRVEISVAGSAGYSLSLTYAWRPGIWQYRYTSGNEAYGNDQRSLVVMNQKGTILTIRAASLLNQYK